MILVVVILLIVGKIFISDSVVEGFFFPPIQQQSSKKILFHSNNDINNLMMSHRVYGMCESSKAMHGNGQCDDVVKVDVPLLLSDRSQFLLAMMASSVTWLTTMSAPGVANGFDGSVGGLGKTKPKTGVIFRDPDASPSFVSASGGGEEIVNELLSPDEQTIALVSFSAPWPLIQTQNGIESRDLANPESAFIQVGEVPKGLTSAGKIPSSFFKDVIFGSSGKYGAYGTPTDIKIKKLSTDDQVSPIIYSATFTTLTPSMRESERKVFISSSIVGNGIFMLVTGTTLPRFNKNEKVMTAIASSFRAFPAPSRQRTTSQ